MLPFNAKPKRDAQLQAEERIPIDRGLQTELIFSQTFRSDNSLVTLGEQINPFDAQSLDIWTPESHKLSAEQANAQYGIPGQLDFRIPITERLAKEKRRGVLKTLVANKYLSRANQTNNAGDHAINLMAALGALAADPLNFVDPRGAVGGIYRLAKVARFARPIELALRNPISRAGIGGVIGNVAGIPISMMQRNNIGEDYTLGDVAIDIAAGGVFGSAFGAGKVAFSTTLARREARLAERALYKNINQQAMGEILSLADSYSKMGHDLDPGLFNAIARLGDEINGRPVRENFYLGDYIYRTDLERLSLDQKGRLTELAYTSDLINEEYYTSFDRAFNLFENQPHRANELGDTLSRIVQKVGTREGQIAFGDLQQILVDLTEGTGITSTGLRDILREFTGVTDVSRRTKVAAKDAFELYHRIRKIAQGEKFANANGDPVELLKNLQTRLRNLQNNLSEVKFNTFKQKFLKLKARIDARPDLRGVNLFDFQNLSKADQELLVEYLGYFQRADVDDDLLVGVLRGDTEALQLMHESIKFNASSKDSIKAPEANKVVGEAVSRGLEPQPQTELITEFRGYDNVDPLMVDDFFVNDQLAALETKLGDDAQLQKLNSDIDEQLTKEVDDFGEGLKESINCARNNL